MKFNYGVVLVGGRRTVREREEHAIGQAGGWLAVGFVADDFGVGVGVGGMPAGMILLDFASGACECECLCSMDDNSVRCRGYENSLLEALVHSLEMRPFG